MHEYRVQLAIAKYILIDCMLCILRNAVMHACTLYVDKAILVYPVQLKCGNNTLHSKLLIYVHVYA